MSCTSTGKRTVLRESDRLRRMKGTARTISLALLFVAAGFAPSSAQEPNRSAWESGWHVVRPGDTLEGLAERFLGTSELWRELHTLNPTVRDPNLLFPGQRLRVFLDRPTAHPSAQVKAISRKVNELPRPAPWRSAGEGDVLLEKDGLRTEKASSARLEFDDGANLTLSEDSLVFIRRQTASSAPLPKKEIEIEVGQADVESSPSAARPGEIEIVVAGARSTGSAEGGKALKTRSRKGAGDAAQFMVYEGKSTVAAGGQKVDVPAGSGTTVAPKEPPTPPEPLLAAPVGLAPSNGEEFDKSAPRLSWSAVPGAASYTVEICRDDACGALVERVTGVTATELAPREAIDGTLSWRATAVSATGLDGFPSPAQRFVAVDSVKPPAPALALVAASGARVAAAGCVGSVPNLEVRATDRSGATLPWTLLVDGQPMTIDEFRALPLAGEHEIAVRVTDARGRSSLSAPARFRLDGAGPWIEIVGAPGLPPDETPAKKRRGGKGAEEPPPSCESGLEVRHGAGAWIPVPCAVSGTIEGTRLALSAADPAVELRAAKSAAVLGGMRIAAGETMRAVAWDVGCGVTAASFRIVPSSFASGQLDLEMAVEDAAGNRRPLAWHLKRLQPD